MKSLPIRLACLFGLSLAVAHAASDVSVTTAVTSGGTFSGGNPNTFTPTASPAVANNATIQTSLNGGNAVTLNTASAAAGNGDLVTTSSISKTAGGSAILTLNALRDLTINSTLSSTVGSMPLALNAGRAISSTAAITTLGGNITLNTVQPFALGSSLNAGAGQILLQTGSLASTAAQTVTASSVSVSTGAAWNQRGTLTGNLSVAGILSPAPTSTAGPLQVSGTLTLQSTATTVVDLAGTSQGSTYDSITATGVVTVAGALQLNFLSGFENLIVTSNTFTILSGSSITGTFSGLPNNSRITLPNELGSIKITYNATNVVLSDWQPVIRDLTWDPGTNEAGTEILSQTNTRAGRHYFRINTQSTDIGAWRSRLTVTAGEADLYLQTTSIPQTLANYTHRSILTGGDGLVLRSDQYTAGQTWYFMVNATNGSQWSLVSGRAWVQDLGGLAWTDSNSNGIYDIGEPALPSGSGPGNVPLEGIRFFKTSVPAGTPAWSLWLNGSTRDIAVRKSFVPFHSATSYYDRKQSGQMLVVAPYLTGSTSTYFLSVTGNPGDAVNLDSRIQEVQNLTFNSTTSSTSVAAAPYRVYRVQVPIQQIAWDVAVTPSAGNANVCVRRDNAPAEFDNDAFSEVSGTTTDSITLVPDFLTDATWFITVYGNSPYTFSLKNGPPTITPLAFTDTKLNDQTTRAGWRFYTMTDVNSQLGSLGWELNLANQVPGTEIAIRRNAVPSRWQSRINGSTSISTPSRIDASSTGGFLQRPGHQADIWYVGIYTPTQALGAFTLTSSPMVPTVASFNGGTSTITNQAAGAWRYFKVEVPAGVMGWDVRLINDTGGGDARINIRRDQLPTIDMNGTFGPFNNNNTPHRSQTWPSGGQWGGASYPAWLNVATDWTLTELNADGSGGLGRVRAMGMGRPLEPGTYYIGVSNYVASNTNSISYTLLSRGIGAGQAIPVTPLAFAGGSVAVTNLAPRQAAYYEVDIPANTPSWEITLTPAVGEMSFCVLQGTLPNSTAGQRGAYDSYSLSPVFNQSPGRLMSKAGSDRYVLLPIAGQDFIPAGKYYIGAISLGASPANGRLGASPSSGVLTSVGPIAVTNMGAATIAGVTQSVSLLSGQVKAYQFSVPAGTASLEVKLQNPVGNPALSMKVGTRVPTPTGDGYGSDEGNGYTWSATNQLLTLANPVAGTYTVAIAAPSANDASTNLVVRTKPNTPLNFAASQNTNGGNHSDTRQMIDGEYTIYEIQVPPTVDGQPVTGWVIKTDVLQGAVSLEVYKNFTNPTSGASVTGGLAVIVPPFLTFGETWYVRVKATGLTNYTLTSRPVTLERPVWQMPTNFNQTFGDSGNDSGGNPLPDDRGTDLGQGEWYFYAVDVPVGNLGLLRTELQAISGNPDLYIRENGVPTTSHDSNGNASSGSNLYDRQLTATATTEYGNWVPLDGRTQRQLTPGRWYLGVKAAGNSNVRYRLSVSAGQVTDLAINGGSATAQNLADNDWRYYRFTVPLDAPENWALTFSQQVGDVVMWLRDAAPPGQGSQNYSGSGYIENWATDSKNQGPYSNVGHDAAGTYTFTTPPLRPGHTYYAGFRSNNSATFSVSSATSGGTSGSTSGTLPVLDFYTGTLNTSVPANSSVLYRIPAPVEATRMKWTSTHASTVQLRLEQGTLPASTGTSQHYYSSGANSSLNNALSNTTWPWQPEQSYYLRIVNNAATAATVTLTMAGLNGYTEWASGFFNSTQLANLAISGDLADFDKDGIPTLLEYLFGGNPTLPSSGLLPAITKAPGSSDLVFTYKRKLAATGVTQVIEHATSLSPPWTPAVHGASGVTIATAAVPGDTTSEQVTVTIPSTSTSRFVRLKATR